MVGVVIVVYLGLSWFINSVSAIEIIGLIIFVYIDVQIKSPVLMAIFHSFVVEVIDVDSGIPIFDGLYCHSHQQLIGSS